MKVTVKDFGTRGDGCSKDTANVQLAIDKCFESGGGQVVFEPGTYLIGSINLHSNIELHLMDGAILLGSPDGSDYQDFVVDGFRHELAAENSSKYLIGAKNCVNVAITGPGEINGSGPEFYDRTDPEASFYSKPDLARPRMIMFYNCIGVKLENSSFIDSPCWTIWLIKCKQVICHKIKVCGDQKMINNDGIDIDSCSDVSINDCFFRTGDDCIVLRAIITLQETPEPCEEVIISNCELNSACQAIRVGCPSDGMIRNCSFNDIVINAPGNGINIDNPRRYLAQGCNGSLDLSNISFTNFSIKCGGIPVRIFVEENIILKRISDLTFSNVNIDAESPCIISGNALTTIENIRFENVRFNKMPGTPFELNCCRNIHCL